MHQTLPPLTGGYPTIGVVTFIDQGMCGWVMLSSDDTGAEIIESGVTPAAADLRVALARLAIFHAEQRESLVRVWTGPLRAAVSTIGGAERLDVVGADTKDDGTYLHAMTVAAGLCAEGVDEREAAAEQAAAEQLAQQEQAEAQEAEKLAAAELAAAERLANPKPVRELIIATDGSRGSNGDGAWAWIDERGRWRAEAGRLGSIAQLELTAIVAAVCDARGKRPLRVQSDSQRAVWLASTTLETGSITEGSTRAEHRELHTLLEAARGRQVTVEWVKGHAGHFLNDRADRLAVHARRNAGHEHTTGYTEVVTRIADLAAA